MAIHLNVNAVWKNYIALHRVEFYIPPGLSLGSIHTQHDALIISFNKNSWAYAALEPKS